VKKMSIEDKLNYNNRKAEVKQIFKDYMSGNVNPIQAVRAIQDVIGDISGYIYKSSPGNLTISNTSHRYSLRPQVSKKSNLDLVEDFKAAIRVVARENGSISVEDHIDKGLSTKHYATKFWEYALAREKEVKAKYVA